MKNFKMTILLLKLKIFRECYLRNLTHLWFNTSLFFQFCWSSRRPAVVVCLSHSA